MKVNHKRLKNYLNKLGISVFEFLETLSLESETHLELLLGDATLNEQEATEFVNALGAEDAYKIIDWEAMNVGKPRREQIFVYAN